MISQTDSTTPNAPPISTHDALSALIWRSVLFIRSHRRSTPTQPLPASTASSIFLPSDARRHLALSPAYVGNAVYQLTATLDLATLLSPTGPQAAASAIRQAITAVTPDLVASYTTELQRRWVEWQFMNGTTDTTGVGMGTDWTSGTAIYGDDWGEAFGPVVRYRYPGAVGDSGNCVLPKLADGSAELLVCVLPEEVEVLKGVECCGSYLE